MPGKHIAPHTIEMAAMWAILDPANPAEEREPVAAAKAQALQRQDASPASPKTTSTSCASEAMHEGMNGISPRYVQDKISNALVAHPEDGCDQSVHGPATNCDCRTAPSLR